MKRSNFCSAISTLAFTLISLTSVVSGVSAAWAPVQASKDAIADSLVANWIAAVGGLEAYRPLQGNSFTLTTEIYDRRGVACGALALAM